MSNDDEVSGTETEGEEEAEEASVASSSSSSSSSNNSSDDVVEAVAVDDEEPQAAAAAEEEEEEKKTPAKAKTPAKKKPPTTTKSPSSSNKKSYLQMAQDAIIALKDRTGSSQIAIQKYILANNPDVDPKRLKQHLNRSIKTGVANKRLIKIKASYKVHPNAKKKAKPKKKAKKAKAVAKKKEKKLTPAQIAAKKEKERLAAIEKQRLERIRKRKFPMDDMTLIEEDKELGVSTSSDLPKPPSLNLVLPKFASACKSDTMGSGILDDVFHIYHFFRGDFGWGRFPKQKQVVAPFTLSQWMECVKQVLSGTAKKTRMIPPLMSHLFVVSLQHLVPSKLHVGLTPASWSEILLLYMDAADRYYKSEGTKSTKGLPGLPIDTEYLLGVTDEPKHDDSVVGKMNSIDGEEEMGNFFYLKGLDRAHSKLFNHDPWMCSAEELLSLLRALVDDLLAALPECSDEIDNRQSEIQELQKAKRSADAHLRKLVTTRNKEQAEEKEKEKEKSGGENDNDTKDDEKKPPTKSNKKNSSVSEAQIESARKAQMKATDAFEKASRGKRIRTELIGEDRNYNQYYHFWNDPEQIYISQRGKRMPFPVSFEVPVPDNYRTTWHTIEKRSVLDKFMESLDIRGTRESVLHGGLEPARKTVYDDIKVINEQKAMLREKREVQRKLENAKLKCEVGRKSGRLAAQSEHELESLQAEIDHLEDIIKSGSVEPKFDMEIETGLALLRAFDRQELFVEESRRRTTRRDSAKKKQEEEQEETSHPRLECSRLYPTGRIDGTGLLGSIVSELLSLEERVEKLSSWENVDRKSWKSSLETAAISWDSKTLATSTEHHHQTASQLLSMLKQPLLQLEKRVYEISGLELSFNDTEEADDNMSTSPEDDEINQKEKLEMAWKKIINRLKYYPAKAHSKIRQAVVEGIAAARDAHLLDVNAQLRQALLQFHPEAAGACKAAALAVLVAHGDYDDTDDDEEEEEDGPEAEAETNEGDEIPEIEENGISSALCTEAIVLLSSLDGQEDAGRVDWIAAVKKAKTVAKMASLVAAFCSKASEILETMESKTVALHDAIQAWQRAARRKTTSPNDCIPEPAEVWTDVNFTDDFCLAKTQEYIWWPARICVAKDKDTAEALTALGRTLVSFIDESGGLRVVRTENVVPFSDTPPDDDDDLKNLSKDDRTERDQLMIKTRRIIRGKEKKASRGKKKQKVSHENNEFKEEKKLAS